MIVATRAGDGQAQNRAADRVDAVFPFFRLDFQTPAIIVLGTQAQEAERGELFVGLLDTDRRRSADE